MTVLSVHSKLIAGLNNSKTTVRLVPCHVTGLLGYSSSSTSTIVLKWVSTLMILFLVPVGVAVLSEEPCCCQWHFSMALILKTVLCQGGDWSGEHKCDFKKRKKHDLCQSVAMVAGTQAHY